jgi:hypothetical protein
MAEEERPTTGPLGGDTYEADDVFEGAEEWSPVETKLVVWSFIVAAVVLAAGSYLVPKILEMSR